MDARQIDALLAVHLFGLEPREPYHEDPKGRKWARQPKLGWMPIRQYSTTWEGLGRVVESMDVKGFEWHVWPKAVEFSQKHKHWDNPLISGYAEGHGYKMNTALAALRCLGVEVPS